MSEVCRRATLKTITRNMKYSSEVEKLRERAGAFSEIGRHKEAVGLLSQALALAPDDADLLCRLCAEHYRLREWKPALKYANQALAEDPESAWGHALRSQILVVQGGKGKEALKSAQEAVRLAPHHAEYLRPLFTAYVHCQKMKEAEQTARRFRELRPDLPSPYEQLATIAQSRMQHGEAEGHLRHALALDPANLNCLNRLGMLLASRMRLNEAVRLLHAAVRLDPADARSRNNLANIAFNYTLLPAFVFGMAGTLLWVLLCICHANVGAAMMLCAVLVAGLPFPLHCHRPDLLLSWQRSFRTLPSDIQTGILLQWRQRGGINGILSAALSCVALFVLSILCAALLTALSSPVHFAPPKHS